VYPALAILQAFINRVKIHEPERMPEADTDQQNSLQQPPVLWVGGIGGMEAGLVKRTGIPYQEIPAAGLHGVGWRNTPGNLVRIWRGFCASRNVIRKFQPDIVLLTGGYLAVPMALAVKLSINRSRKPKNLLFVPDIEPGLALKTLANFADRILLTADESKDYFSQKSRMVYTGYPVREELKLWADMDQRRERALEVFGLTPNLPTLLVFGGSKGARSINKALLNIVEDLIEEIQIIHICGTLDWPEIELRKEEISVRQELEFANRYQVFPYLHENMGAALAAADLVVSRAGASILGEFPLFGLPAVLVPYPYAWRYQMVNAGFMEQHSAALVLADADLTSKLYSVILDLFHDPERMAEMRRAMLALSNPNAAEGIAMQIERLALGSGGG